MLVGAGQHGAQRSEDRDHRRPGLLDGWPESRNREFRRERDRCPDEHDRDHTGCQGVHVEQRQRRPVDVVWSERCRAREHPREMTHLVSGDHAALGRARGTGGVDQGIQRSRVRQMLERAVIASPIVVQRQQGQD